MSKTRSRKAKRGVIRGSGDYTTEVQSIVNPLKRVEAKIDHLEKSVNKPAMSKSAAASTIGRTLGNFVNQGDLGALAGSQLAKWFGHGDYSIKSNSLMKGNPVGGATFSKDGKRGTRIVEREYLGDVLSGTVMFGGASTVFTSRSYRINPTDAATFPWLSQVAHLYDQWEPNGIVFEFISTSSEYNGSSQALGAVIMATDYDGYDPVYSSKQEMENADYACSTKPSENLLHGIECDKAERPTPLLYTSTSNGAPVTMTELGKFQVATQGCSALGVTLGELWVSYDITFYKKQLSTGLENLAHFSTTGTTTAGSTYWPSSFPQYAYQITLTQQVGVGSTINFNNQAKVRAYMISYFLNTATLADRTAMAALTPVGCAIVAQHSAFDTSYLQMVYLVHTSEINAALKCAINVSDNSAFVLSVTNVPLEFYV